MKVVSGLIIVIFFLVCPGASLAVTEYTINPWWIQKRVYENGQEYNRLAFGILQGGSPIQSDDANPVVDVSITDPNQNEVTITREIFDVYETIYGQFDLCSFQYYYDSWMTESYYIVDFSETPIPGTYVLTVETDDGAFHTKDYVFNGLVELPQISSKSFRGGKDSNGNFFLIWDPPSNPEFLGSDTSNLDVRTFLEIYDNSGDFVADVFVFGIPVNFGYLKIPSNIVQQAENKGVFYKIGLQVRTKDNNNRYYSTSIPVDRLPQEKKSGVVVVPLN